MKLRLFKKYFLTVTVIIFASFFSILMILSLVLNNYVANDTYKTLKKGCQQVSLTLADVAEKSEDISQDDLTQDFLSISRALSNVMNSDMFITDSHGTVLVCACDEWQENGKCLHSSYIMPKDVIERALNSKRAVVD